MSLLILSVLLVFCAAILSLASSRDVDNDNLNQRGEYSLEEFLARTREESAQRYRKREEIAASITSIEQFDSFAAAKDSEYEFVALLVAETQYTNGNYELADYIVDNLSKSTNTSALQALRLCVMYSDAQVRKNACRDQADVQARQQGIIKETEQLPDSYFQEKNGD